MHSRIKMVRKSADLTQQEFADRIGVSRGALANYEVGRNEPIDAVISLICREFNINEEWLRTGKGKKERPVSRNAEIEAFMNSVMHGEDADFRRRLVAVLAKLDTSEWELLEKMAQKLAAEANSAPRLHVIKKAGRDGSFTETVMTDEEVRKLQEELDSYPEVPDDL